MKKKGCKKCCNKKFITTSSVENMTIRINGKELVKGKDFFVDESGVRLSKKMQQQVRKDKVKSYRISYIGRTVHNYK